MDCGGDGKVGGRQRGCCLSSDEVRIFFKIVETAEIQWGQFVLMRNNRPTKVNSTLTGQRGFPDLPGDLETSFSKCSKCY